MKTKHTIIIFIIGIVFSGLGLALRMSHLPFADVLLIIGTAIEIIGGILFLYKLFTCPDNKNLFDC